jgi:hypothetical protein
VQNGRVRWDIEMHGSVKEQERNKYGGQQVNKSECLREKQTRDKDSMKE